MNIYEKLQSAREFIKNSDTKKQGKNTFSKYDYFTPEQVEKLVFDACKQFGIIDLFEMKTNQFGVYGILRIININKTDEVLTFEQSTAIPDITATNIAQQVGGAVTYTKRYMLMTCFGISENSLDFDDDKVKPAEKKEQLKIQTKTSEPETWLNIYTNKEKNEVTKYFINAWQAIHNQGKTIADIRKIYKVSKETETALNNETFL